MSALAGAEPPPEPAENISGILGGEPRFAPAAVPTSTTDEDIDDSAREPADGAVLDAQSLLESLVAGAVRGEKGARERLLTEIHPLVLRYCRGRLGRQETLMGSADDVAQEVCLAVVNALPGYTLRGLSFRAFVYGIAAPKVTDAFRAIGRNRAEPMADLPDAPALHDGPEQRLLSGELTERLGHLLYRLTPRQREVLVLRVAVGMSAEETAVAVGSTPGAVRVTQHRALNRLRGILAGPADVDPEDPDDRPDVG
jgi:RNA polymerase sigma-70 factor (ECF subfamily)